MSRIKYELQGVNLFDESHWEEMNQFFLENLPKFENSLKPFIKMLR